MANSGPSCAAVAQAIKDFNDKYDWDKKPYERCRIDGIGNPIYSTSSVLNKYRSASENAKDSPMDIKTIAKEAKEVREAEDDNSSKPILDYCKFQYCRDCPTYRDGKNEWWAWIDGSSRRTPAGCKGSYII